MVVEDVLFGEDKDPQRIEAFKAENNLRAKYGENWEIKNVFKDVDKMYEEEQKEMDNLYGSVKEVLKFYMDMSEDNYHLVALWIIGTYIYNEFETFPLLFINATKGSGKTRLLKLLEALCKSGKIQSNLSEAVLFRDKKKHTVLLDEFEQAGSKEKGTLRELINASYKRGARVERMAKVKKDGKETFETETFDLYSPIAMANIWGMDDVVEDRCINIRLDRSDDILRAKLIEDFSYNPKIIGLVSLLKQFQCRLCHVVVARNIGMTWNDYLMSIYNTTHTTTHTQTTQTTTHPEIRDIFDKIDRIGIYGRHLELFFPLLIISKEFGEECFQRTLDIAKSSFAEKNSEEFAENPDITLLDFLWRTYYEDHKLNYIKLEEMFNRFKVESPSSEEMDIRSFGWMLKRLNIILSKVRHADGRKVMLDFAKIYEKLQRYKGVIQKDV